jgi:NADP-dependent 3-hydroxy acid dehydrogenase YdfG
VTGGSSGLVLATAKRFAREGAMVYSTGRRQAELDSAALDIEHGAKAIRADIANAADLDGTLKIQQVSSSSWLQPPGNWVGTTPAIVGT